MTTCADEGAAPAERPAARYARLWRAAGEGGASVLPDLASFLAGCPGAAAAERLAVILVDQRERWRRGRGRPVEDYLAADPEIAADPATLCELVHGELSARRARGEDVSPGGFAERFPALGQSLTGQLSMGDIARLVETHGFAEPTADDATGLGDDSRGTLVLSEAFPGRGLLPTRAGEGDGTATAGAASSLGFELDHTVAAPSAAADVPPPLDHAVRFSVRRRLGKGGMGVVYEAFDRRRNEPVALKTMKRVDPVALYQFKQEFRTLADLSHPNLVDLHELIAIGDLWFFTMELVRGQDFVRHVRYGADGRDSSGGDDTGPYSLPVLPRTGRALDPEHVARLRPALRQLAEGVSALHEAGKLHRDIKPTNVLVTAEGRVVLLDFGLSAELGRSGLHHAAGERVVGTVAYMSPEQAAGQPLSAASDWYSVGVMLYEALVARLPFDGPTAEVMAEKIRADPPPPSALVQGVPADLNDLCTGLLRRGPQDRPTGPAVLARLAGEPDRAGRRPAAPGSAPGRGPGRRPALPLVGRERHREALDAALAGVRAGRSVLMLVSGRSGSGKSTLLQAFLDDLIDEGEAVVLQGRCYERESVPFKALDTVVDALSRYLKPQPRDVAAALLPGDVGLLARMFPALQRVEAVAAAARAGPEVFDHREGRRRALAALRELLARIGRRMPLVVAVDDLQWGDAENAPMIAELLRPPDAPVMLLVGLYRTEDGENSPLVRALRRPDAFPPDGPDRRELAIGALTYTESRELALALLGRDDRPALADAHLIARESQGNPFFIDELAEHVRAGEGPAGASLRAGQVVLGEVLWARVARLPEGARRLLEVVAVSRRPVSLLDARQAADLGAEGRAAAAALRAGRLVRGTGQPDRDEVEPYHDWVRETVLAHLPPGVIEGHHLRLAEVLESSGGGDPEALAFHYQAAGRPDRAAGHYARAADRAAESLAFAHAAGLYRLAIDLRPAPAGAGPDAEAVRLRSRLGDALASAGRGRDAAAAYLDAAGSASATAAEAVELRRRAAMQLLFSGHVDDGFALLRTVLRARGMSMPEGRAALAFRLFLRRAWLRLRGLGFVSRDATQVAGEDLSLIDLCWSAGAALGNIDPARGADFQTRGLALALRAGEPYRVARAFALEAATVSLAGRRAAARAADLLARTDRLARALDHPHLDGLTALAGGVAALMLGRWEEARRGLAVAEPILRDRCTGVAWELDTLHNMTLSALTSLGDLPELAPPLVGVCAPGARERGDLYAETSLNTFAMTLLRLADDEPGRAASELDRMMARWSHRGYHVQHAAALRAWVSIHLYRGEGREAWDRVEAEWPLYRRSRLDRVQLLRVQMTELRARAALAAADAAADPTPLLREARRGARSLERERLPWASAHAAMIAAGLRSRAGVRDGSAGLFRSAAGRYAAADMRLHAAAARRRAGQLLGSLGRREGQNLVDEANDAFAEAAVRSPALFAGLFAPLPAGALGDWSTSDAKRTMLDVD